MLYLSCTEKRRGNTFKPPTMPPAEGERGDILLSCLKAHTTARVLFTAYLVTYSLHFCAFLGDFTA